MATLKRKPRDGFPRTDYPKKKSAVEVEPGNIVQNKRLQHIINEDIPRQFKAIEVIGEGGFGKVVRAVNLRTKAPVVIKSIPTSKVLHWTDQLPTEIHILKSLKHKNIVPMLKTFEGKDNFQIMMPDTDGQNLLKYLPDNIEESVPSFPWIAREVAQALLYLHEDCQIVHQDIKLENVIIFNNRSKYRVQLIDFGAAKRFSKGGQSFVVNAGTPPFACKEYYTKTPIMGPEADVFSFGVFLYAIYFIQYPFPTMADIMLETEVKMPHVMKARKHAAFRKLLVNTLTKVTANRWTINMVLSSEWMQRVNNT